MAHSLGNLVVWDALRLYQALRQSASYPLARNVIGVEAAVWPETFWDEEEISYQSEPNPQNRIDYSVEELKQHSWSFWFNQARHPAKDSLAGQVYHSFVPDDEAIEKWMRFNDNLKRGSGSSLFPIARKWHYSRNKLTHDPPEWRSPEGNKHSDTGWGAGQGGARVVNRFADVIPTLMLQGHRAPYYGYKNLNLPVGTTNHPLIGSIDENAADGLGWREKKHSDFAVGESFDANEDMWFPIIWDWYAQFVQPAITIGEE